MKDTTRTDESPRAAPDLARAGPLAPGTEQVAAEVKSASRSERAAALAAGASEGLGESFERYDLANQAQRAIHHAGALAEAAATQAIDEASRWPTRRPRRNPESLQQAKESVQRRIHDATDAASRGVERTRHVVEDVVHTTQVRIGAVTESARRAAKAPAVVSKELGKAAGAYAGGAAKSAGLYGAAAFLGMAALIVFTVGLVALLNMLIGSPWGTFVVAALYGVGVVVAVAMAQKAMRKARERAGWSIFAARQEIHGVMQPVREAFGRDRKGRTVRLRKALRNDSRALRDLGNPQVTAAHMEGTARAAEVETPARAADAEDPAQRAERALAGPAWDEAPGRSRNASTSPASTAPAGTRRPSGTLPGDRLTLGEPTPLGTADDRYSADAYRPPSSGPGHDSPSGAQRPAAKDTSTRRTR